MSQIADPDAVGYLTDWAAPAYPVSIMAGAALPSAGFHISTHDDCFLRAESRIPALLTDVICAANGHHARAGVFLAPGLWRLGEPRPTSPTISLEWETTPDALWTVRDSRTDLSAPRSSAGR